MTLLKHIFILLNNLRFKISNFLGGTIHFRKNVRIYSSIINVNKESELIFGNNFRSAGNSHFELSRGSVMKFGDNVTVNYNCQFYGDITIGDYCTLASEVYISSYNHNFKNNPHLPIKISDKYEQTLSKEVIIGDDVWIGKNVFIAQGVYIAKGTIIGSNAKITKSIYKPYSIIISSNPLIQNTRFGYKPINQIITKSKFYPYLLQGFKFKWNQNKIISAIGSDLYFLFPFHEDAIHKIEIRNLNSKIIQFKSVKTIKLKYNETLFKSEIIDNMEFINISNSVRFNVINIKFDKKIDFIKFEKI